MKEAFSYCTVWWIFSGVRGVRDPHSFISLLPFVQFSESKEEDGVRLATGKVNLRLFNEFFSMAAQERMNINIEQKLHRMKAESIRSG